MKKIILILLSSALFLGAVSFALAKNEISESRGKGRFKNQTSTSTPERDKNKINVVCIQNALDRRESSVITAFDKKAAALRAALEKRKIDLKEAWAKPTLKARIAARIAVWKNFRRSEAEARKTYRQEVRAAWQRFKNERKTCEVQESGNESEGADHSL